MTGAQAAGVYYGPAARHPLKPPHMAATKNINMKPPGQLASDKFVF